MGLTCSSSQEVVVTVLVLCLCLVWFGLEVLQGLHWAPSNQANAVHCLWMATTHIGLGSIRECDVAL